MTVAISAPTAVNVVCVGYVPSMPDASIAPAAEDLKPCAENVAVTHRNSL